MDKYCVDANVFIDAWQEYYSPKNFPSFWKEIANIKKEIILIRPIFDEIEPIPSSDNKLAITKKREKYPIKMWLIDNKFTTTLIDDNINKTSLELEKEYEIEQKGNGANRNDILLISYAKEKNKTVVTQENHQSTIPGEKCNYRIPLICKEQGVECINLAELIDRLGIVI